MNPNNIVMKDNPFKYSFTPLGYYLRDLRIGRKVILRDMADALGVKASDLSRIEYGKDSITIEQIKTIISHYNLNKFEGEILKTLAEKYGGLE